MILHLVTDRRRLCPRGDERARRACLLAQARYAVEAGIDVIQVRERDLDGGPLAGLTAELVALSRGSSTRIVVNERLDVALAAGAHGVHLRGDSFDASRVRAIVPRGFVIGRSVHARTDLETLGPVDYVIAGTVWATPSKPDGHPLLGIDGFRELARATSVPVLAIGGVDLTRAPQLAAAGASGVAAIGLFQVLGQECGAAPLNETAQLLQTALSAANI